MLCAREGQTFSLDYDTPAQKSVYERVAPWLRETFGIFAVFRRDVPMVAVQIGSAMAQISVAPWGSDDATITTRAYVVAGIELTPDLMHFLLRENDKMRFGAFGIDKDDSIFFEHTIVGSSCDKEELKGSVMAVVLTADEYDDQIIERWGGSRVIDRVMPQNGRNGTKSSV